jgi:hypothetical protein
VERLYEEEKREGLLSGNQAGESRTQSGSAERQNSAKQKRDWQGEAYKLVNEYEILFADEDWNYLEATDNFRLRHCNNLLHCSLLVVSWAQVA